MERAAIISLVSAYMDEINPEESSANIISIPDPLIDQHLNYAAERLLELLPVNQQMVFSPSGTLRTDRPTTFLKVTCPSDFIKLSSVKISGWDRSVTSVMMDGETPAQTQVYRYMSGTKLRPTAILGKSPTGWYLELRPATSDQVTSFYYVKKRQAIELEDALIDPLVYLTAARVYESIREFSSSKVCYEQLDRYIKSNAIKSTN